MNQHPSLSEEEYQALAEFRYLLRSYLHFSETAIRSMGLRPQQYLLLLAIKGMPKGREPTMSMLAKRMQLAPQTLVELADRVEQAGWVSRRRDPQNNRRVLLSITPTGEAILERLSILHKMELLSLGPQLVTSLQRLIR
jgi:DNA-binding MarR family transcriptional regulator